MNRLPPRGTICQATPLSSSNPFRVPEKLSRPAGAEGGVMFRMRTTDMAVLGFVRAARRPAGGPSGSDIRRRGGSVPRGAEKTGDGRGGAAARRRYNTSGLTRTLNHPDPADLP